MSRERLLSLSFCFGAVIAFSALLTSGCSSDGHKVGGKVHKSGSTDFLKVPITGSRDMTFLSFVDGKKPTAKNFAESPQHDENLEEANPYGTDINEDGTFSLPQDIPDGKYLVLIAVFPDSSVTGTQGDSLKGKFNVDNSNIVIEVTGSTQSIDIDLDVYLKKQKK